MSNLSTLNVLLSEEHIGTITHLGDDRTKFAFTESYIEDTDRPILSLGFKDAIGELFTDFRPRQNRLTPFFSNLLPEKMMRNYLAEKAGVNSEREFFLLWALGQDLPGAITIESADGEALPPGMSGLTEARQTKKENAMRFSLAGAQLKFPAVQRSNGRLSIPENGTGGSWIVKLPTSSYKGVPENEFSMMELARHMGMDVPETKLLNISDIENIPKDIGQFGKSVFAIKRFDRSFEEPDIHIEDFAQVFTVYPGNKYKKTSIRNIAELIGSEGQEYDIAEFIRRLVFNTLIGNADMHLKNWSLIYRDRQSASIAPAYDFVSTIPYLPVDSSALTVSRSKRFSDFTMDELSHLALKARLPEKLVMDTAIGTVSLFHQVWNKEKNNLALSNHVIKTIEQHLKTIPLVNAA